MFVRVLAGLIHIEVVMRMLEGGDAQSAGHQQRYEFDDERCFARSAPTGNPQDPRVIHCAGAAASGKSTTGTSPAAATMAWPLSDSRYKASLSASGFELRTAMP